METRSYKSSFTALGMTAIDRLSFRAQRRSFLLASVNTMGIYIVFQRFMAIIKFNAVLPKSLPL